MPQQTSRRGVLAGVGVGLCAGSSGCLRMAGDGNGDLSDVDFGFTYGGPKSGDLTIEHQRGTAISADTLHISSDRGTQVEWPDLGSTIESPSDDVTEGSTAELHEDILNWPTDVRPDETIYVTVDEDGSPTTLGRFTGPERESSVAAKDRPDPTTAIFFDSFEDEQFLDQWTYLDESENSGASVVEEDGMLSHEVDQSYNISHADIHTQNGFETSGGRVTVYARLRRTAPDFWGYGFGLLFSDGAVSLREHQWEGYDRLAVYGVEDRPEKYASDYTEYGRQTHRAKLASATESTDWIEYSMTVDTGAGTVQRVVRDDEVYDLDLSLQSNGDEVQLVLGRGRGHDIEYDSVALALD